MRPSHRANLAVDRLEATGRTVFGTVSRDGDRITVRFGAISELSVRGEARELVVELSMDPKVPEEVARETIARYNRFLEEVTGYSSKERARRLRKSAGS